MKTINKFKSRKDWVNYVWAELLKSMKNPSFSAAFDSLLSSYEKEIIVNRLAAISLIRKGKTYKQIGEELWLSPATISSLKKVLKRNSTGGYQSYRSRKNKKNKRIKIKRAIVEDSAFMNFMDRVEYFASVFPKKTGGGRWNF